MNKLHLAVPLAAVLVVTAVTMAMTPAYAGNGQAKGNPDFDITTVSGYTMTVAGTAGGTQPNDQRHVFAYVFAESGCPTTLCAVAVTSHALDDSLDQSGNGDLKWHAHNVQLTSGPAGLCVTSITDAPSPTVGPGNTVSASGSGTVFLGLTATLNIDLTAGTVCVQSVIDAQSSP